MTDLFLDQMDTPIGPALLVTDAEGTMRALDFADYEPRMMRLLRLHYGKATPRPGTAPASVKAALTSYFAGELSALDKISCATNGTDFQRRVWAALRTIKPGTTLSYGRLAAKLGRPNASRAVGLANGANPIAIIVPCHRVIGANGTLTGYGGGLPRKQWLLAHEGGTERLV
jgi:methylated-DNA-[protein]-cysteine S-methyltransferase